MRDKKLDEYMAKKVMGWYLCEIPLHEPFWSVSAKTKITSSQWAPTINAGQADLCLDAMKIGTVKWRWLVTNHSNIGYKVCLAMPHSSKWDIMVEHKSREIAICRACKTALDAFREDKKPEWLTQDKKEQEQKPR